MPQENALVGSPITVAELRELGRLVRWQELDAAVNELLAAKLLPSGYPLMPSRLPSDGWIDLWIDERWRRVKFLRLEGRTPFSGNQDIVYLDQRQEKSAAYNWYGVAPAGHFTEWKAPRPDSLESAELLKNFELTQDGHVIHTQALVEEDWPYLTFEVDSFHPRATWVDKEDMWKGRYTVHAADPRVKVRGVVSREPWFNATIAVSHRWLTPEHPDPDGIQHRELLALCDELGLHENQTLLIDYCALPQERRNTEQEEWFRENLPGFQEQFKYTTLVLNTGSADYASRAWCVFELMLAGANRAKTPTLLNHDRLDEPLRAAKRLANTYLQQSVWNQQQMSVAFAGGLDIRTYEKWISDPMNVALYNATIEGRNAIIGKFERELGVKEPNDRPVIIALIRRLLFNQVNQGSLP
jgi:hypothetical protein